MSTVTLHIGAFKTGTSFVQTVMSNNKSALADDGVLWPGEHWSAQVRGVKGPLTGRAKAMADWQLLVDEIDAWDGGQAVISMEALSMADSAAVERTIKSLRRHRVRVVLSARDLGRVFPAQWQESVQNKWSWSYQEYLSAVTGSGRQENRASTHFWSKQDWPTILRTWGERVSPEDLILVTVPPSGSDRGLLWSRMCQAFALEPDRYVSTARVNESLGAASAEVMRYVTAGLDEGGRNEGTVRAVKKTLSKSIMAAHKGAEPTLILPTEQHRWAERESRAMIDELRTLELQLIGDLADLNPRFDLPPGPVTSDPSSLSTSVLLEAATHGLIALCAQLSDSVAVQGGRRKGANRPPG